MMWLKQSTAVTVNFGPFVDATDGVSLETGLVTALDNATTGIRASKNGGNYAARNTVTATTYDETGEYKVHLDTTDTDTLGRLKIIFEESATCLPVWQEFMVLPANVYDSLVGGSDTLDVQVAGMDAAVVTTAALANDAITADKLAANCIGSSELANDAIGAAQIAADAIQASRIQNGAITAAKFGAGAIDATAIATGAIDADAIAAAAITAAKFAAGAVDATAVAAGAIHSTAIATDAIDAASIEAAAANKIADHIIRRSLATAQASSDGDVKAFRSLLGAISKLVNRVGVSGTDLLTYETDDTTTLGTQAITTDASADPITDLNTT